MVACVLIMYSVLECSYDVKTGDSVAVFAVLCIFHGLNLPLSPCHLLVLDSIDYKGSWNERNEAQSPTG